MLSGSGVKILSASLRGLCSYVTGMTETLDASITMGELLERFPGARRALFQRYHIGGCASCGYQPEETLASVCARNENLPVEDVIEHIAASHEQDSLMLIEPNALADQIKDGTVRLVDIRSAEEFEAAPIEGAIFFNQDLMQEMMASWDRNALTVFVDHKGTRVLDAAAYFVGHGWTNVRGLRGGVDAWSDEVNPDVPRYDLE